MAHFAEINSEGVVQRVIVAEQNFINSGAVGDSFNWIQTSYNNNFRKQFAGKGMVYDKVKDIFMDAQPYPSWVLDENNDWKPPVKLPDDCVKGDDGGKHYIWDEDNVNWKEIAAPEKDTTELTTEELQKLNEQL